VLSAAVRKGAWWAAVGLLGLLSGCGDQYRPVITPINPVGPAPQPQSYFIAISGPGPTADGVVNILDASGDTLLDQATLGAGPFSFALNGTGTSGYNLNGNAGTAVTLNSYGISVAFNNQGGLQTKNVESSTLSTGANPVNIFAGLTNLYLIEPYTNFQTKATSGQPSVAAFNAAVAPPSLLQEIPVAPNPVNFAGTPTGERVYAISQSATGAAPLAYNACNTPTSVTQAGEVSAIETTTNTVSTRLPVGICPVYGIMSADTNRTFILNRGSNTVTVINSQQNLIDSVHPSIPVGAGPVSADIYTPSSQLVTANYDSGTLSIINVNLDIFGNDGPNFGQTVTVKVGNGPVAVSILPDGTRAYVANELDGTVSVVDMHSFQVTKTIPVAGHPHSISSLSSTPYGKVYVASMDDPNLTVIRTDTDTVSANVLLQGNAVDVRSTSQTAGGPSAQSIAGGLAHPEASGSGSGGSGSGGSTAAINITNPVVISHTSGQGMPCGIGVVNGAVVNADPSPYCINP
jgi:YVTN family beta-propeller protein